MPLNLKELLIVLAIAITLFHLAKPIASQFGLGEGYGHRRDAWLAITTFAFISPNFWVFAVLTVPVLIWASRRESNPGALYLLLLQIIPPISVPIPMIGISHLFRIDNYLLLSFFVMVPAAVRILRTKEPVAPLRLSVMDYCLLDMVILTSIFFVNYQDITGAIIPVSLTDSLRRMLVSFFTIYVPYFVISRSNVTKSTIDDTLSMLCLACSLLAAIAIFETYSHWLLYGEIAARWGQSVAFSSYYERSGALRGAASSGHPLALGFMLAIAFGGWLYLKTYIKSRFVSVGVMAMLCLGLLASYSRGPWVGAILIYFVFSALSPRALPRALRSGAVAGLTLFAVSLTPLGARIASVLPFMGGTVDSDSLRYRQRLLSRAWELILQNPIWGDQTAYLEMRDLRQGEA